MVRVTRVAPMVPTGEDLPKTPKETKCMHAPWFRASLVGVTLFAISGSPTPVLGNHGRSEGVIVAPAETVLAVPTSYEVPTATYYPSAGVLPTSYVVPTVLSTSYALPTVYSTSYVTPTYS